MTRRRANNHAVQEEPGHSSHARAANSVSDASDDYDNDEAVLSEGAALRTSEDIATPERVSLHFLLLDSTWKRSSAVLALY